MRVNLMQTGVLFGLGDVIAQRVVEKRNFDEIHWLRTVRYVSIGCGLGPTITLWYRVLDRMGTKNTTRIVVKKVLIDQLVASPIFTAVVLTMSRVFSGDEWPIIQKRLEDNYVTVMLNSSFVWPFVQLVNFSIVPQQWRVLFVQLVALAWNTYLSCMSVGSGKT